MPLTKHFMEVLFQTDILWHLEGSIQVKMVIHAYIVKWAVARVLEPGCWIKGRDISLILVRDTGNPQEVSAAE